MWGTDGICSARELRDRALSLFGFTPELSSRGGIEHSSHWHKISVGDADVWVRIWLGRIAAEFGGCRNNDGSLSFEGKIDIEPKETL